MKIVILSLAVLGLAVLSPSTQAQTFTQTFSYTGSYQSFVVPSNVITLTVKLWGAGGGGAGGSGAFVTGDLAVTPGSTLTLLVGEGGSFGSGLASTFGGGGGVDGGGGAGGGRTAIRLSTNNAVISDELVTAAGGAGARLSNIGVGGGGGLSIGGNGTGNGSGGGATQIGGGVAGSFSPFFAHAGSQFLGGNAGAPGGGGGGGGGGYFGGGGSVNGSGGGGGSSYFSNPAFTFNSGASQAGQQGSSSGVLPGGAGDLAYLFGVGTGGANFSSGGNGYISLSYVAIPEPGSLLFLALGTVLVVVRRRSPLLTGERASV